MSRERSLAEKAAFLRRRLDPWPLEPIISHPQRWHYRRKVCLVAWYAQGWRWGVRRREERIAIPDCPVHHPQVNATARAVLAQLPAEFPLAYYVQQGTQVTLVVRSPCSLDLDPTPLQQTGVEGVWLHLNPCAGRRIFGKLSWQLVWGRPRSRDEQGLWHGPSAFSQVIPDLARQALDVAEQWLGRGVRVLDLCCGTGASLQRWSGALGVELGREAVECAHLNAPQAQVLRGTCAQRLPQIQAWLQDSAYHLYANPARLGLEPEVLDFLSRRAPERAAYLSCSAGTLRRDLERLKWRVERLVPFDFFPQTNHVEVLALLEK